MLLSRPKFDSPDREEHELEVNGKRFLVEITREQGEPVFGFPGPQPDLAPHERDAVIQELGQLSQEFKARRVWGSYRPINAKSWTKKR
jgi:hypothetical protein